MSRHRRPPSRAVRVTAVVAGLVVLAGAGVAVAQVVRKPPAPAPAPALAQPPAAPVQQPPPPSPAPSIATPLPAPARASVPTGAAGAAARTTTHRSADQLAAALGAPPGPQVDARPARTAAPADRYAFLVGITRYPAPTHPTVAGAQDARAIAAALRRAGWRPGNIRVVTDEQATGRAVLDGVAWLAAKSRAGRTFSFFHYSGHVRQLGGGTEALWPVDRSFVYDKDLARALQGVKGRLWVDIAGCEAASFAPGLPGPQVLFTGSSKVDEKSYEYAPWHSSVWSGLLFDVGTARREADADRDRRVTMGEALRFATYYAQAITLNQKPYGRQTPQSAGDPVRGWTLADPPA